LYTEVPFFWNKSPIRSRGLLDFIQRREICMLVTYSKIIAKKDQLRTLWSIIL